MTADRLGVIFAVRSNACGPVTGPTGRVFHINSGTTFSDFIFISGDANTILEVRKCVLLSGSFLQSIGRRKGKEKLTGNNSCT